jgi:hypothetical protein
MNTKQCSFPVIALVRAARTVAVTRRYAGVMAFLLLFSYAFCARAAEKNDQPSAHSCGFSDEQFDPATDVHAIDEYSDAIAQLLMQEKFSELDCMADAARIGKTRFSGGDWKLAKIYIGVDSPRPGHPTQEDWKNHMQLVERWTHKNSRSITARIALAESYIGYAWDARGDGYSDSVSDSGWKLFSGRISKAKLILDQASMLKTKCPEWYLVMEQVAQGQSWDLSQLNGLLNQAVAFEPDYQYYYRVYAYLLQPKWFGQEGDAARFAEDTANKTGGDSGDILYFQITNKVLCACNESEFGHFSWPRLQKGFAALEKEYGPSLINENAFALMATKSSDWVAADPAFKQIGDSWNQDLWRTQDWFKQMRDAAAQYAPIQVKARVYRQEAEANVKSPAGKAYLADFNPRFAAFEQSCVDSTANASKSEFFVQVGKDGDAEDAHVEGLPDAFTACIMKALYASYLKKETPFPPPPAPSYRLILAVDPASLNAASK